MVQRLGCHTTSCAGARFGLISVCVGETHRARGAAIIIETAASRVNALGELAFSTGLARGDTVACAAVTVRKRLFSPNWAPIARERASASPVCRSAAQRGIGLTALSLQVSAIVVFGEG